MMRANNLIARQCEALLDNKRQAIFVAIVLAVLPLLSWLSVALVSLITLRKGGKAGFEVLVPSLVVYSVPLMMLLPLKVVLISTLSAYVPCYCAALALRRTPDWRAVFAVFFILASGVFIAIQLAAPEFVSEQFILIQKILSQHEEYKPLVSSSADGLSTLLLAHLFFGFQILSQIIFATCSLMFARSMQAKLFMPGGFLKELTAFRCGRLSFLVLLGVCTASYFEMICAIDMLPLVLTYFFASGFALIYFTLARKRQLGMLVLMVLFILLKPMFMLSAYIIFGALDSLFNFRLYLPTRAKEST